MYRLGGFRKEGNRMMKEMSSAFKEPTVKWERQIFEERITMLLQKAEEGHG